MRYGKNLEIKFFCVVVFALSLVFLVLQIGEMLASRLSYWVKQVACPTMALNLV